MNALLRTDHRLKDRVLARVWVMVGVVLLVPVAGSPDLRATLVDAWPDNLVMIIGSMLAMLLAAGLMGHVTRLPLVGLWKVALGSVLVSLLILVVAVLLTRSYYSRSFLILASAWSVLWLWAGHLLIRWRMQGITLGLVERGSWAPLRSLDHIEWVPVTTPDQRPQGIRGLVVDMTGTLERPWAAMLTQARFDDMPVLEASHVYEAMTGKVLPDWVGDAHLGGVGTSRSTAAIKRVLDCIICIVLSPILLIITAMAAIFVKFDSPGPVFYFQDRVGLDNRTFRIFKIRTMVMEHQEDGPRFADEWHGRITRVGRLLRRCRIDEIPQFWNVLRGEMSIVGPRPEQRGFVDEFVDDIPFYGLRHLVRPGLTGWAQVNYGYASGEDENRTKLEYDLFYLKHWSFSLDLLILLRTVYVVLLGIGAR